MRDWMPHAARPDHTLHSLTTANPPQEAGAVRVVTSMDVKGGLNARWRMARGRSDAYVGYAGQRAAG